MRCDVCHRNIEGTKRLRTIYGWIQFCPECKVRWENRPIKKEDEDTVLERGDGYLPDHDGTAYFTCPRCGCGEFDTFAQTVPADRDVRWTYEYQCARCKTIIGLTLRGNDRGEEE